MLLQRESNPALNTVTAYGHKYIEINQVAYEHAVYFAPEGNIHPWEPYQASDITKQHLLTIAGLSQTSKNPLDFLDDAPPQKPDNAPEVVLIGTGSEQVFLPSSLTQVLLSQGIGLEVMSTQAAARTYNILMAEGRRVIVALLPQQEIS